MNIRQAKFKFPLVDILTHYKHEVFESGSDYVCCCPFHHERTPSFHLYTQKREYHCFGCGVHGDVIGFIQAIERLETVSEALEFLSNLEASRQDPGHTCKSKSYSELLKENADLQRRITMMIEHQDARRTPVIVPDPNDLVEWEFFH